MNRNERGFWIGLWLGVTLGILLSATAAWAYLAVR